MKDPSSLLSLVLNSRYSPHGTLLDAELGNRPSFIWRSLVWGRDLLRKGLNW